jgi:hypothetical protein
MADITKEPAWQLMAIAAIGLGIALIILIIAESRLPRTRKFLTYEIQTFTPDILVVNGRGSIPGSVVMMLKIMNTGNIPITPLDFGGALCFHLEEDRKIYSAEIVDSMPSTLRPMVDIAPACIVLHPTRLAGHESMTIKAVIDGRSYGVRVNARLTCLNNHVPRSIEVNAVPATPSRFGMSSHPYTGAPVN